MDEYISKQRAKDLMGCCLASAKAEYKAAKGGLKKARYGDYISAIQSMIDVVGKVEAADVQPVKRGQWGYHCDCIQCNVCEFTLNEASFGRIVNKYFKFCPNCGADMRGEAE